MRADDEVASVELIPAADPTVPAQSPNAVEEIAQVKLVLAAGEPRLLRAAEIRRDRSQALRLPRAKSGNPLRAIPGDVRDDSLVSSANGSSDAGSTDNSNSDEASAQRNPLRDN